MIENSILENNSFHFISDNENNDISEQKEFNNEMKVNDFLEFFQNLNPKSTDDNELENEFEKIYLISNVKEKIDKININKNEEENIQRILDNKNQEIDNFEKNESQCNTEHISKEVIEFINCMKTDPNKILDYYNSTVSSTKRESGITLLGKKTKNPEKIEDIKDIEKLEDTKKDKVCGRKKKFSKEERSHDKMAEDDIILKIKSFLFNSILKMINKILSLSDEKMKILKIEPTLNKTINKTENEELLNKTIKDLLFTTKISKKYKRIDGNNNKILIEKIYKEGKTDLINMLELKYKDYLDIFRLNASDELKNKLGENIKYLEKIDMFVEKIIIQEKKKLEGVEFIKKYVKKLVNMCFMFEKWFEEKIMRKRK